MITEYHIIMLLNIITLAICGYGVFKLIKEHRDFKRQTAQMEVDWNLLLQAMNMEPEPTDTMKNAVEAYKKVEQNSNLETERVQ